MKKTVLVALLVTLGPVAATAGGIEAGKNGLAVVLEKACAIQPAECAVVARKAISF